MRARECLLMAVALLHASRTGRALARPHHTSPSAGAAAAGTGRCASPVLHHHIAHDDRASHVQLWAQRPCDAAPVALSELDISVTAGRLAVTGKMASTPFRQPYTLLHTAVPDEVTAIYTKGHVLRITCPTQPKKELYQRSINVSVEPAATPVSAAPASSSQNARLNGSSQARPTVTSTGAPVTVTRQPRSVPSKPPDPARETQRPSAKSPPAHDRSAEHRPDKNRKDYVRAPPRARECTGRYCRRNWHGNPHFTGKNPRDEKKPRDQEDDVVFVADEARSNAVNEGVPSVTEILEREGELNVEEYIRALEVDFAHIKNAV